MYRKILVLLVGLALFFSASHAHAVICAVCTAAVAGTFGLSRWLAFRYGIIIDDTILGVWIGALILSMIIPTITWLTKKNIKFFGRKILIFLIFYGSVLIPLYTTDILGHPQNKLIGIDKLLLGIILGSIFLYLGGYSYHVIKAKNNGHALFPFQKVVMPVTYLIILTVFFYFITRK